MADASTEARPRSAEHHVCKFIAASLAMQNAERKHCFTGLPQNLAMHIGKRLQRLMLARNISTSIMAAHCGVTQGAVSNWFATGRITKVNLLKAAGLLRVSVEDIISGAVGERGPPPPAMQQAQGDLPQDAMEVAQAFNRIKDPTQRLSAHAMIDMALLGQAPPAEALALLAERVRTAEEALAAASRRAPGPKHRPLAAK